jgi:hypothetical protein
MPYTGFGLGFVDFDQDGELDLYVANGRVGRDLSPLTPADVFAEPNQLFRGLGNGRFAEFLPQGGTPTPLIENSRAALFGDYDNDGDTDIVIVNNGGPARLLANRAGDKAHWIRFRLRDRHGNDAVGSLLRIRSRGRDQWRVVGRSFGYQSSHDPRVHFGLGMADGADEVRVTWLGGQVESFGSRAAGQSYELRQGTGQTRAEGSP